MPELTITDCEICVYEVTRVGSDGAVAVASLPSNALLPEVPPDGAEIVSVCQLNTVLLAVSLPHPERKGSFVTAGLLIPCFHSFRMAQTISSTA